MVLKMILDFVSDQSRDASEGWWLLGLLATMLLLRSVFFGTNFNVSLVTAVRLCGATQYLGFSKLLRLSNVNDKVFGQLVTCITSDQERIMESVVIIVIFFGKSEMSRVYILLYKSAVHCPKRNAHHVCAVNHLFVATCRSNGSLGTCHSPSPLSHNGNKISLQVCVKTRHIEICIS